MRTDIYVNTITGDIVLKNQNSLEEYLFEWIEETDLQLTAQIILPSNFWYKATLHDWCANKDTIYTNL